MSASLAIPLIWIMVAALLIKLLTAWDQLPDRVAVHFGMALQPNGWSSKSALAAIVLIAMLGQAALATFVLLRVGSAVGMVAVILLTVSVAMSSTFWQVIDYNAQGRPFQPVWIFIPLIVLFLTLFVTKLMLVYYRR